MSLSSDAPDLKALSPSAAREAERYRCGTLQYTKTSLFALFSWMIWGKLCFDLFENSGGPSILSLYLQDNFHISNFTVNILFSFIPMVIGTVMTPIISFKSDRTRSILGRRIPYILYTAPFLVIFSIGIGFSDDIVAYCKFHCAANSLFSPLTVALFAIGFLTIGFSFFNEFVGTVYYYLLPDVMPRHFIGRFQGISGMAGQACGVLTNIYITPYQLTHIKTIHVSLAVLYFVGFGLVCWRVKEGQYPPVTDVGEKTKFSDQVRLYFRECFVHPVFILFYVSTGVAALSKGLNPAGIFGLHLSQHQAKVVAHTAMELDGSSVAANTVRTTRVSLAMTPDGKWLVSGGADGVIKFWDNADGKAPRLLRTLSTQRGLAPALAISSDGKTVVSGSAGGLVAVWDTSSGQRLRGLTGHTGDVHGVALSRDGTRLASASADKTVRIWDLASGACLYTLAGHDDEVRSVAFSSDARQVVSGGNDKKILLWDAQQGVLLRTLEGSPGPVYTVCFAPGLGPVPPQELPHGNAVARAVDSTWSFLRSVFTNESLYDIPVDRTSKVLGEDMWVLSGGRDGATDEANSRVRIWNVADGKLLQALKGHKQAVSCVAYKPDLRLVFSGSSDGSVRVWKPLEISPSADDKSFKTFSGYTRSVSAVACPDAGARMVNASATDGSLHVWDIDRGISLAKGGIRGIFFSLFTLVLAYPIGMLVDRWNPIRTTLWTAFLLLPIPFFHFLWYHDYTFGLWMDILRTPISTLSGMAGLPMVILLYPKTKYGQMSSANALVRQAVIATTAPLGALFMDYLTVGSLETDYFRYGFLFQSAALTLQFLALLGVYYYWKKLGGENYVAPEAERVAVEHAVVS